MSPEQAQGKILDARSDVFSVGAMLYEVFAGRRALPTERFEEAAAECRRSLLDDPLDLTARIRFAQCLSVAGRKQDAEIDAAADWTSKAIAERHAAVFFFLFAHADTLRQSPRWPALARLLNLPATRPGAGATLDHGVIRASPPDARIARDARDP